MAQICIRCGKQADGLLCPECAAPPGKKAKVEPPKPPKAPAAVVIAEPTVPVIAEPVVVAEPTVPVIAEPTVPVIAEPIVRAAVAPEPPKVVEPPKPPKPPKAPKTPKAPKAPKPPKAPKAPKVKREYSTGTKRKARQLVILFLIAAVVITFLPQIKSGFASGKDFVASRFTKDAAPKPSVSPTKTSTPEPTETATKTPTTPTTSPTTAATKKPTTPTSKSPSTSTTKPPVRQVTSGARSAVNAALKKCAQATVYSPPGCPFAETIRIHGNSVDWSLSGTPTITLITDKAGVQTLKVTGKAVAHVHYGKVIRDVDHSFTRTAIATPSDTTYTIKWK